MPLWVNAVSVVVCFAALAYGLVCDEGFAFWVGVVGVVASGAVLLNAGLS